MNKDLRTYINTLFADAPPTKKTVEVKEEILQNLIDKYNDLLSEGKSEEAAYNISVASVGDISALLEELKEAPTVAAPINDSIADEQRKKGALLTAVAISLYILCVLPVLLIANVTGIVSMFVMIAIATALLVYKGMTKPLPHKVDDTMMEDFLEWRDQNATKNQLYKSISSALWLLVVVVYMLISFGTGAWHITWILFLIAGAASNILKAVFDLRK